VDLSALEQGAAVMVTGVVTLLLEIAWFRSLRAAFHSTTDAFALMLVSVLVPLAAGAALARRLPSKRTAIAGLLATAGVAATLATLVIERFDVLIPGSQPWYPTQAMRLGACLVLVGLPVLPLGTVLPFLLDRTRSPRPAGRLYALNTLASVAGALVAAWLLLPGVGFARTAWLGGLLLVACGAWLERPYGRRALALVGAGALAVTVAWLGESGVGRLRAQARHLAGADYQVLFSREAPDATVSVIARPNGERELIIDGFQTSVSAAWGHYLDWMGHLPMAFHRDPRRALVICFGTGRTAYAVAKEGPEALDIVDLSRAVLAAGEQFPASGPVLADPRVRVLVMDGRAWLRRTTVTYDVITLEPMAPYHAGTNALYSVEFYRLAAARLNPGGRIAQWLPMHLMTPDDAASITRTFQEVFPDARLWMDPVDHTGILLGLVADGGPRAPAVVREMRSSGRNLATEAIHRGLLLDAAAVRRFGRFGELITDDNQRLAYGEGRQRMQDLNYSHASHLVTLGIVGRIARGEEP
jgi:spermidine synthase